MGLLSQYQATYYGSGNSSNYGDYQFTSLADIINGFMVAYVGESKLISKVSRTDVQFHGMRAIQEFSYDIFRSVKSQEIEVPNTLKMILPQDYVNYVKLTTSGNDGIKRNLYPTGKTSNPFNINQTSDGTYDFGQENFRKITITCPGGSAVNDGDRFQIQDFNYITGSGTTEMYFVFNIGNNNFDTTFPSDTQTQPRFSVDIESNSSAAFVASQLADQLKQSNRFKISVSVNVITLEYTKILSSYSETAKQANTSATQSSFGIAVVDAGGTSTSTDLQYGAESETWSNYKSHTPIDLRGDDYESENFIVDNIGGRYGLDPQHAHDNGTFYIDYNKGFIHFGSALAGKTVVLDYISDGLGTDEEMVVHKFAEEAVYKWIAYGIISSRSNMPEYIVQRFKKERFAEARKAKIRLSNIKIEEFTQVLKGLSKPIK